MNRIILFSVLTITLLFGGITSILVQPTNAVQAWYHEDWPYRKQLTINPDKIECDLTNFPVMVLRSSDTDLRDNAQDDGDDILFTDSNQQKLDHEIELFDGDVGNLVAWVKVPNISSGSDTVIYMYYGNDTVSNQQNPAAVWDSNYNLVHHLSETLGTVYDSTSKNNDGITIGGVDQNAAGHIFGVDGSDLFHGDNDFTEVTNPNSLSSVSTIELWFIPHIQYDNTYDGGSENCKGADQARMTVNVTAAPSSEAIAEIWTAKYDDENTQYEEYEYALSVTIPTSTGSYSAGTIVLDSSLTKAKIKAIDYGFTAELIATPILPEIQ